MPNIVETATATNSFKTLMTAVKAAGLMEALSGPGPFTFFAPNNGAFAKLPKADVEELLTRKRARLTLRATTASST